MIRSMRHARTLPYEVVLIMDGVESGIEKTRIAVKLTPDEADELALRLVKYAQAAVDKGNKRRAKMGAAEAVSATVASRRLKIG